LAKPWAFGSGLFSNDDGKMRRLALALEGLSRALSGPTSAQLVLQGQTPILTTLKIRPASDSPPTADASGRPSLQPLVADTGERGSRLFELAAACSEFEFRVTRLRAGDYLVAGRVLVERKT
jgi:hypothetical protein